MKKELTFSLIGLSLLGTTSCSTAHKGCAAGRSSETGHAIQNLVQYAKPMCGTARDANTFPGAVAPFGMTQWSPDTEAGMRMGGYSDQDTRISGFSMDHISGAGCTYGGDFAFMPILGAEPASPPDSRTTFATSFSHSHEIAKPGDYAVTFDNGIEAELTTTMRSGFGRFTYPASSAATMMINAASDVNGAAASGINVNPASHEISGWSIGGYFCHSRDRSRDVRTIYFSAVFDQPFGDCSLGID